MKIHTPYADPARARKIAEALLRDPSRAGRDAVIYIRDGKPALAAEHSRRNLDNRAMSRAMGAITRKLRPLGLWPASWGTDAGELFKLTARELQRSGSVGEVAERHEGERGDVKCR